MGNLYTYFRVLIISFRSLYQVFKNVGKLPHANTKKLIDDLQGLMVKKKLRVTRFYLESTEPYNNLAADMF